MCQMAPPSAETAPSEYLDSHPNLRIIPNACSLPRPLARRSRCCYLHDAVAMLYNVSILVLVLCTRACLAYPLYIYTFPEY
ncbi:hypothetical protein BD311DRAFT_752352 [Dichomitus squalens]|uniref:Uncharacterized protein n=1 Tax=Dichomitus squalens TaxID=114155 RepID=A0A4Q9MWN3_9APHY|nr:hypothetical protein BD311DRAFT_752352 [Dichomitus squalens]